MLFFTTINFNDRFKWCEICLSFLLMSCHGPLNRGIDKKTATHSIRLIILAPAHFHAALLQNQMYDQIDSTVHVFAEDSSEVASYLSLIRQYNQRPHNPTHWTEKVYIGPDYLTKMLQSKPGDLVIIAGNNRTKIDLIKNSIDAGLNVLADKPMAITKAGFEKLCSAFEDGRKKGVFLYDIMTERFEVTNILQRAFSQMPDVFGKISPGTVQNPAVCFESTHYFYKNVSGKSLRRPAWYFDVDQQGEGIVDVTTHMVDLIQWECFPDTILNYKRDIQMLSAKHWPTYLTLSQFQKVTGEDSYPGFLNKNVNANLLSVYANGEMNYTIRGVHAKVTAIWKFEPPQGTSDTYSSTLRGTKANLVIRQGKDQQYKPVLFIQPKAQIDQRRWKEALDKALLNLNHSYPGLQLKKVSGAWQIVVPQNYALGHEQHFALVVKQYLQYIKADKMAPWEVPNMLAKYFTTTQALEMAKRSEEKQ